VRLVAGDPARVPLVCVAGGGAHALFLRPLATRLADRTVYGVHARGIESREAFDRTVEDRAGGHLADLRAVHPTGPYVLAGHSFGGLVAYEMARLLRAEGVDVPLLVLLDTDLPDPSGGRLDDVVPRFHELYPGDGLGPRTRRGVRLAYVSLRRRSAAALGRFRELSDPRRREAFAHLNAGLGLTYEPAPAPGPVLLLRAECEDEPLRLERAPDLGWGALVTSDLRVEPVPAHHVTMVREPEVAEVARVLAQALDEVDRARRG
jgi:thioesterase domain-containing protein